MSLKVSHILTIYTLEGGLTAILQLQPGAQCGGPPRMQAWVRVVGGRLLHIGRRCCLRPAEHLRPPESLSQVTGDAAAWGRAENSRTGTPYSEQVQPLGHNPRSRMAGQGLHCSSGPGALGMFSDPRLPDTYCQATAFTPWDSVGCPDEGRGTGDPQARVPSPPLTAHSTAVNRLHWLPHQCRSQPHLLGGQAPRKGFQSIPVCWPGLPATTETLISILIALLLSRKPTFRDF